MKRTAALMLALAMVVMCFAACGGGSTATATPAPDASADASTPTDAPADPGTGMEIYFLNFKPEIAEVYDEVAAAYKAETGVTVKVVTAASGTYEQTLTSEVAKSDAPTIFQVNGPVGLQNWKDYCLDLSGTELYDMVSDKSLVLTNEGAPVAIPYATEGYGIIYNDAIMQKYFALENKATAYTSMDEINTFDALKAVVEDMTANKEALGIQGVFASTSMGAGEQWRWQTHLANVPFYHEFMEAAPDQSGIATGLASSTVQFSYGENMKNIFDLYIENSVTEKNLLGAKTISDSMAEFALGQAAMVQNGNWAWADIAKNEGNVVAETDIKFLPIYTGVAGEDKLGICIGCENFFCINSQVSPEKQAASIAFLEWLFGSETGKDFVVNKLGFLAPFNTFGADEQPADPLAKEVIRWMNSGVSSIPWVFNSFPSEDFKNYFGAELLAYAEGSADWATVTSTVQGAWEQEWAKTNAG